jgi:hypothetical protein
MFSSALVLLTAWERLSSLGSLDTRNGIEDLLAEPAMDGLGLDVEGVTQILYVSGVIAAVCAVATAILGYYVLKPDTSSRRAITILAVPLFVTGLTAGGFAASFVAAGAAMLWMQPAREWFATGKWTPPSPPAAAEPSRRTTWGAAAPPADRPAAQPLQQQPVHPAAPRSLHHRPRPLIAAFVLTVVTAGGVLVISVLSMALVGLSPDLIMTELERQRPELVEDGLTLAQLRFSTFVSGGVAILWCSAALAFAGFAMARRAWARRALMIIAAFSAGACLLVSLSAPFLVVPAIAAMATVACLGRIEVRRWFAPEPHSSHH